MARIAITGTNSHYVSTDASGVEHLRCAMSKPLPKKVRFVEREGATAVCHRCNNVNWH